MFCCAFSVFLWPWCPSLVQWLELPQSHQVILGALSILVAYFWLDLWFESEPARVFETIPGSRVCIQIMKAGVRQWGVDTGREAGVLGGGGGWATEAPRRVRSPLVVGDAGAMLIWTSRLRCPLGGLRCSSVTVSSDLCGYCGEGVRSCMSEALSPVPGTYWTHNKC